MHAWRIRASHDGDLAAILALNQQAFAGNDEARLVARLHQAGRQVLEYIAEHEGAIIGHVLFSPIQTEHGHDGLAVGLAPLAVAPEHQRQGIGAALVAHALDTLRSGPYRMTVVLGEPTYYARFGFRPASLSGLRDTYGGGDAFMALALREGGLDGYSGRVDYCPEFASLEH